MPNRSKQKGSSGERELCRLLEDELLLPAKSLQRNLEQYRDGSSDIVLPHYMIEVKRQEVLNIDAWWDQVTTAALKHKCFPILAYRQNRKPWQFCLPASLLFPGDWGYLTVRQNFFFDWFRYRIDTLKQYDDIRSAFSE